MHDAVDGVAGIEVEERRNADEPGGQLVQGLLADVVARGIFPVLDIVMP